MITGAKGLCSNSLPTGSRLSCSHEQAKEKLWRNCLLYTDWLVNLLRFQGAWPGHVQVESSCSCFPRELVSFVHPRVLVSFDPQHMFSSNRKTFWAGRYNKLPCLIHSILLTDCSFSVQFPFTDEISQNTTDLWSS